MPSVEHDSNRHLDLDRPLPDGWTSAGLGVIADSLTYGYTASAAASSRGPRFLRITDIQNGTVDWNSVPTCKIDQMDVRKYGLSPGDIVFARTGATTGKSFLIHSCPPAVFASYLIRLRLLPGINPAVLAYFFQTPEYWAFISDNVAGIAQPNCNATKLSELQVPIPPSGEQQRLVEAIAASLSKVDAVRDHLSRVPAILKRFRQAVLAAACSGKLTEDWRTNRGNPDRGSPDDVASFLEQTRDLRRTEWTAKRESERRKTYKEPLLAGRDNPFDIPDDWCWATIDQVTSLVTKGSSPGWQGFDYTTSGTLFVRSQNIRWGHVDVNDVVYLPAAFNEAHASSIIREGDVLLNLVGASVGRCAVAPHELEGANCNQAVGIIRLVSDGIHNKYLALYLISPAAQEHINDTKVDVARANCKLDDIRPMLVPVPPPAEQQEIVRRVEVVLNWVSTIEHRASAAALCADKLAQSILAKAFRGELVPTEAELARREGREYEPASVLLERIKAERVSSDSGKTHRARRATHQRGKRRAISV
jgi:type I restriction enzyme, S subunit